MSSGADANLLGSNLPCKDCGHNALAYYDDGHTHCFSGECGKHMNTPRRDQLAFDPENIATFYTGNSNGKNGWNKQQNMNTTAEATPEITYEEIQETYSKGTIQELKGRQLKKETCAKYGVKRVESGPYNKPAHYFPLYHRESGNHIGIKIRGMKPQGNKDVRHFDIKWGYDGAKKHTGLFGQNLFPSGSAKAITVTTGEYDAMAAFELTGSKYPCVSIPNGDDGALKALIENWKYLDSFEKIVLAFDNDVSGKKARDKVVNHFKSNKIALLDIPSSLPGIDEGIKDVNDYLRYGTDIEFTSLWWKAEPYTPQDLILSSSLKSRIKERKNAKCYDYPWEGLNEVTYGMRKEEIALIKARRGVGKTAVIREIAHHLLKKYPDEKIGAVFVEETPEVSGEGLMSISANKRLHLPDTEYTEKEWEDAYNDILKDDRIILYEGSGENSSDVIFDNVEWMYYQTGAEFFIIDSITLMTTDHSQDERKKLDAITSRMKDLKQKFGLHFCVVVHENREGEVRGSDGPENMASIVISLERDQKNPDPAIRNTTNVVVEKNRFSGDTGPACGLTFNGDTGRLKEKDFEFGAEEGEFDRVTPDTTPIKKTNFD